MKKILGILACGAVFGASPLFAIDLNVHVKNPSGAGIPGAQVIAVQFTEAGVGSQTKTAVADAAGLAAFTGGNALTADNQYDIFATTQGYLPSLGDQYGGDHPSLFTGGALSDVTITLSSAGVVNLGEIHVDVRLATPSTLVFGEVRPASGANRDAVARGFVTTDGAGFATGDAGRLRIFNVPFASTDAYTIAGVDTATDLTYNFRGTMELAGYRSLIRYISGDADPLVNHAFDFNNAVPVQQTQNVTQNYAATGAGSVEGVVIDTTSAQTPIPHIGINFGYVRNDPYCGTNCSANVWSNTDDSGRFQLFGLQENTSYYAQIYGGCNWQNSTCYEGSNSTWTAYSPSTSAPLGINDFYYAATPLIKKLKLNKSSGGSGQIAVYIKDSNDRPLPQSGVGLWPDGMGWETDGSCIDSPSRVNNPGLANANVQATTGYALISGLPAGNYSLQAWTQFTSQGFQYNAGPDGEFSWGGDNCGTDDLRVSISTTAPYVSIFDSEGNQVGAALSSITITVPVTVNTSGLVKGTLHFPGVVDLSNDPINITMQPQEWSNGGGGFTVIDGSAVGPDVDYTVNVASGQAYWLNVTSNYWGVVRSGGGSNQISLVSTGTVTLDMKFAPAGRLIGKLYKPDTSIFQPTFGSQNSVQANVNASAGQSWGWSQVSQDGGFTLGGLLPGTYKLRVNGWGQFTYADPQPLPTETVYAGRDTYRDLSMVAGVALKIDASTSTLPAMNKPNCAGLEEWSCPPEQWAVIPVPQGTDFSQKIMNILVGDDDELEFGFAASTSSGGSRCDGPVTEPGFCVKRVPSPTTLDFYLLRKGQFDEADVDGVRPYFVILHSTKNIAVNSGLATGLYYQDGSTISVQAVNLTPPSVLSSAVATFKGDVTGQNIIRQQDFEAFGGDFNSFLKYIPLLSLIDSSGTLRAAGAVLPSATCFAPGGPGADIERVVAEGNWLPFKSMFDACGASGYEIRGLNPGQTYTAVLTSVNYPPYQTQVTMDVSGSTRTLNINLDQAVGSGATLAGVVTSTNGVVIGNAEISIEAPGFNNNKVRTVMTSTTTGVYQVQGLPAGTYRVGVVAAGYALAAANVDVSGTSSFTSNFALRAAGAAITGTIKSASTRKRLEGVRIFAYNDTLNVNSPAAELPLYRAVTSSVGYRIDGLEVGVVYKVFAKTPGYYIANQSTLTVAGTVSGIDFLLRPKPLDVESFANRGLTDYEFTVPNLDTATVRLARISESPYVLAGSTDVLNSMRLLDGLGVADKKLVFTYPLSNLGAGRNYVLHIEGNYLPGTTTPSFTKEVIFGLGLQGNVQSIDDTLLGNEEPDASGRKGNAAVLDMTANGNKSALSIPVGAMIPQSTSTIPSLKFTEVALDTSPAAAVLSSTAAFASGIYQLEISSVSLTAKGFDLTLAYDIMGTDTGDLAIHKFNDATQKWDVVPGLQTIANGTVTIKRIKSLASVLGLKSSSPMRAMSDGQTYTPNANYRTLAVTDSGSYAVMRPSLVGTTYAGTTIKVFNFPNPFNLTTKTNTLAHGGATTSLTTAGTVIKYELPSHINGHVYIRIYTLAGELVREFDQGEQSGGAYYYTAWDGKNKKGVDVANGVYYGVLSVPGAKLKDSTFKMAVIK